MSSYNPFGWSDTYARDKVMWHRRQANKASPTVDPKKVTEAENKVRTAETTLSNAPDAAAKQAAQDALDKAQEEAKKLKGVATSDGSASTTAHTVMYLFTRMLLSIEMGLVSTHFKLIELC